MADMTFTSISFSHDHLYLLIIKEIISKIYSKTIIKVPNNKQCLNTRLNLFFSFIIQISFILIFKAIFHFAFCFRGLIDGAPNPGTGQKDAGLLDLVNRKQSETTILQSSHKEMHN